MSPRTRRRPTGRVEATVRQAGRDLGAAVRTAPGAAGRAVVNRTTKVQCPWCDNRPWIPKARWEDHAKAHRTADARRVRNGQRIDVQRRQQARQAEGERERASRPVNHQARAGHGPAPRTSPHVRWVDDDGNPIDWSPGQPLPPNTTGYTPPTSADPELNRPNPDHGRFGVVASVMALLASLMTAAGRALAALLRGLRDNAPTRRGRVVWLNGTPRPAPPPDPVPEPEPAPPPEPDDPDPVVVPIRGGPMPPRTRAKKTAATGSSPAAPASAAGASGMGDAATAWARAVPETLVLARFDAQAISEALAEVANALRLRANLETDRGISPHCVEPYEEAAAKMLAAADDCQEVHGRLLTRYGSTAEDLARPDTPDADYLKEGV